MNRIVIFLFFAFLSFDCLGQIKKNLPQKEFTKEWKSDSLGENNFRNSHIYYSKTKQTILINGVDIRGFDKMKVEMFLGKPNESGIHKEDKLLIISYKTKYFKSKLSDELLIYFDKKNIVNSVSKKEDRSNLYLKK